MSIIHKSPNDQYANKDFVYDLETKQFKKRILLTEFEYYWNRVIINTRRIGMQEMMDSAITEDIDCEIISSQIAGN